MRGVERAGDLGDDLRRARRRPAAPRRARACAGRRPRRSAWRCTAPPVALARVVDRDDVGVVDRGRRPRLAHEAVAEVGVLGQLRRDQLQRDGAVEVELEGPVDDAHAAAAGDRQDPVAGELVSLVQGGHRAFVQEAPLAPTRRGVRCRRISSPTSMRGPSAIRTAAWGVVVLGAAAPLVRRRLRLPPPVVTAAAAAAPLGLSVAMRRLGSRATSAWWACRCSLRRELPDAQRRSRAPARACAHALSGARRPDHRPRRAAGPAPAARVRGQRGRAAARRRAGARVVPLAVVRRPARDGRLPARAAARSLPARRHADLRGLRPRAHRLLDAAHRAAVVRGARRVRWDRASRVCVE